MPSYTTEVFTIPAGRYYLGDPCYAIKDEHWIQWLDACGMDRDNDLDKFQGSIEGKHDAYAFTTAHGDGVFHDTRGKYPEFGVDAGMIGLVPLAYLEENNVEIQSDWAIVSFERPTGCSRTGGRLMFGEIIIPTDWDDEGGY
jgi:hypothetical protein